MYSICTTYSINTIYPAGSDGKESACNVGDLVDSWVGKIPGGGNGNPRRYSCQRIPRKEDPGGLQPTGSQRVRQDWATEHSACVYYVLCAQSLSHV